MMSVVPPPISTSATPSSRSSGNRTASAEARGSSTRSLTAVALWAALNALSSPGSAAYFHNYQYDPGYLQWRQEADREAANNPAVAAKLQQLDTQLQRFDLHRGAPILRFDHLNLHTPRLEEAFQFWTGLGFRCSEYISTDGLNERITGADIAALADRAPNVIAVKYGLRDSRGGGRASARETATRVAAGAIARKVLPEVTIRAALVQIGPHRIDRERWDWDEVNRNPFFCPDPGKVAFFEDYLDGIRKDGSSVGAVVEVVAEGVPAGLGAPDAA